MTQRGRQGARPAGGSRPGGRPRGDLSARRQRLRDIVEPVVSAAGYDLEELTVAQAGRRHLVRLIIDGDRGVSLDAVADVSRAVGKAFDQAEADGTELLPGEYQLEVSSPGVDRPLTLTRHWRRSVGRLVKVAAGGRQVTARVVDADDERVVLEVAGTATPWAYADLGPGHVQVEFGRSEDEDDEDEDDEDTAGAPEDLDDDFDDDFDDDGPDDELGGEFDDDDVEDEER